MYARLDVQFPPTGKWICWTGLFTWKGKGMHCVTENGKKASCTDGAGSNCELDFEQLDVHTELTKILSTDKVACPGKIIFVS